MAAQKPNRPVPSHIIARAQSIPERFLLKVLKPLVSSRVLYSVKGPNGGYRLARPGSAISMLEIVEGVDGSVRGQAPLNQEKGGPLNHKLDTICRQCAEKTRLQLERVKLADLAFGRR
jgi:Rrf2 family protein